MCHPLSLPQVRTRQAFSDQSVTDALEASGEDVSGVGVDIFEAISEMGHKSVENGTMRLEVRTATHRSAAAVLKRLGLAHDKNTLAAEAVTAVTSVSEPALVANVETAYGRRSSLQFAGWTLATSGRDASLADGCVHPNQCKLYYKLVQEFLDQSLLQEESGWFSHSQGDHYYETLLAAFEFERDAGDGCEARFKLKFKFKVPSSSSKFKVAKVQNSKFKFCDSLTSFVCLHACSLPRELGQFGRFL